VKVSVIIPVYNRERFIRPAILSLLRQRDEADLDIIVVDDGSTDGTSAVVSELAGAAPNIRMVYQAQSGIAQARNTGLDHIHPEAELVAFLDSDDISVKGRFAAELPLFREDPDLALTYSMMTLSDSIDDRSLSLSPNARACTLRGINLGTAIFRRTALAAVGRFDDELKQSEDFDYLLRFFELPLKYRLLDHVSLLYRRHAQNITGNRNETRRYFSLALLRSIQRRRRAGNLAPIPKFCTYADISGEKELLLE
jgi:glycosyltransferase involved in cell wall biosynthesis